MISPARCTAALVIHPGQSIPIRGLAAHFKTVCVDMIVEVVPSVISPSWMEMVNAPIVSQGDGQR